MNKFEQNNKFPGSEMNCSKQQNIVKQWFSHVTFFLLFSFLTETDKWKKLAYKSLELLHGLFQSVSTLDVCFLLDLS